jgi:spermidine dehydrogenase
MKNDDNALGMNQHISRRDFVGGALATATAIGLGGHASAAQPGATPLDANYYPPALQGLRGDHPGSFEAAHSVRDAGSWAAMKTGSHDTGENYDLVVVGGGISGLAAAYFFRQQHGPNARILILENHDDFGGHAKRNEFYHDGRTFIGYGGTEQIYHGPWEYSPVALGLIRAIGVDTDRFYTAFDWTRYARMRLTEGVFFDRETFGRDHLAVGETQMPWEEFLASAPLPEIAKKQLVELYASSVDYLPTKTVEEKMKLLASLTYNEFLLDIAKVDPIIVSYLRSRTDRDVLPTDYLPALEARTAFYKLPGMEGMGLPQPVSEYSYWKRDPEEIFHFPDGNAGVARLLIRSLIPAALVTENMETQVTARLDYSRLDGAASPVRVRLSSIVVGAQHIGNPENAKAVSITYLNAGKALKVRADRVVMACNNSMIPFLCPEMPASQRAALSHAVRTPLVYTNVFVANWRPWQRLGVHYIHSLSGWHTEAKLDFPVDLGTYKSPASPDEPIVLHLEKRFFDPGPESWKNATIRSAADRARIGRSQLLGLPFDSIEREIRQSLSRMLSPAGFDPVKDILGITVNRWPHGYAAGRDSLVDPNWPQGEEPWVLGRQRFGRIAVANSDAAGDSVSQAAIDEAYRAVNDLRNV